ncbi:MAG: 3'-5' exonuclease [Prosthecobacter sp.]
MQENHIMVDLETLGTAPGSVILSIGAVQFGNGGITGRFTRHIHPASCQRAGLTCDAETALWWMTQSDPARTALVQGQKEALQLEQALLDFMEWLVPAGELRNRRIWGNGASFDCALLSAAYRACNINLPWRYSGERCYRTIKALHPDVAEDQREGTHHCALADAEHQARHLMKLLPNL